MNEKEWEAYLRNKKLESRQVALKSNNQETRYLIKDGRDSCNLQRTL